MKRKRLWQFLGLIGLVLGFCTAMMVGTHVRARRKVEAFRAELAARGESLRIDELAPVTPADSNAVWDFLGAVGGLTPLSSAQEPALMSYAGPGRALVAWKHAKVFASERSNAWPSLEAVWSNAAPNPAALRAALQKPVLVWNLDYQKALELPLPHLSSLHQCIRTLAMGAVWEMHRGNGAAAWADLDALSVLVQRYRGEPQSICQLVRSGMARTGVAATWQALQFPGWSDAQLAEWQKTWSAIDLFAPQEGTFAMEMAVIRPSFDQLRQSRTTFNAVAGWQTGAGPNSAGEQALLGEVRQAVEELYARTVGYWAWKWWDSYDEELCALKMWHAGLQAVRQARREQAWLPAEKQLDHELNQLVRAFAKVSGGFMLDYRDGSQMRRILTRITAAESQRRLLVAALAIERYRLRHGRFPGDIAALVPGFMPEVPLDWIDGKPLRYQLKGTNAFVLYSIGADGEDNGGDAAPEDPAARPQMWNGRDWVWPRAATPEEADAETRKK